MMKSTSDFEREHLKTVAIKAKLEEATNAALREHEAIKSEKKAAKNLLRRIVMGVIKMITPNN